MATLFSCSTSSLEQRLQDATQIRQDYLHNKSVNSHQRSIQRIGGLTPSRHPVRQQERETSPIKRSLANLRVRKAESKKFAPEFLDESASSTDASFGQQSSTSAFASYNSQPARQTRRAAVKSPSRAAKVGVRKGWEKVHALEQEALYYKNMHRINGLESGRTSTPRQTPTRQQRRPVRSPDAPRSMNSSPVKQVASSSSSSRMHQRALANSFAGLQWNLSQALILLEGSGTIPARKEALIIQLSETLDILNSFIETPTPIKSRRSSPTKRTTTSTPTIARTPTTGERVKLTSQTPTKEMKETNAVPVPLVMDSAQLLSTVVAHQRDKQMGITDPADTEISGILDFTRDSASNVTVLAPPSTRRTGQQKSRVIMDNPDTSGNSSLFSSLLVDLSPDERKMVTGWVREAEGDDVTINMPDDVVSLNRKEDAPSMLGNFIIPRNTEPWNAVTSSPLAQKDLDVLHIKE